MPAKTDWCAYDRCQPLSGQQRLYASTSCAQMAYQDSLRRQVADFRERSLTILRQYAEAGDADAAAVVAKYGDPDKLKLAQPRR